jgi:hypothetical protein
VLAIRSLPKSECLSKSWPFKLEEYEATVPGAGDPKQAIVDVYNADPDTTEGLGGSSAELLAKPQNTNDKAYCILANAVYPSTNLPFNQPVAFIRLSLEFLGTNRVELGERFVGKYKPPTTVVLDSPATSCSSTSGKKQRTPKTTPYKPRGCGWDSDSDSCNEDDDCDEEDNGIKPTPTVPQTGDPITPDDQKCLVKLHELALARSLDADRLLLTQEEYAILTKEAFWPKKHFEIRHGRLLDDDKYQAKIGVRKDWEYWGVDYHSVDDMQSDVEDDRGSGTGLTFVKDQFLPRTGISYVDVVDLLRTRFINPNMLDGRNRKVMEAFRLTYKFMMGLVGEGRGRERFCRLVEFIDSPSWHRKLKRFGEVDVMDFFDEEDDDRCADNGRGRQTCRHHHPDPCSCKRRKRLLKWLCTDFERMGKLVVLESVIRLPREAKLVVRRPKEKDEGVGLILKLAADMDAEGEGATFTEEPIGLMRMDQSIIRWNSVTSTNPRGELIGRLRLDGKVQAIKVVDGVQQMLDWSTVYPEDPTGKLPRVTYVQTLTDEALG